MFRFRQTSFLFRSFFLLHICCSVSILIVIPALSIDISDALPVDSGVKSCYVVIYDVLPWLLHIKKNDYHTIWMQVSPIIFFTYMNTGTYITSVKHQERTTFSEPSLTKIILPLQGILFFILVHLWYLDCGFLYFHQHGRCHLEMFPLYSCAWMVGYGLLTHDAEAGKGSECSDAG